MTTETRACARGCSLYRQHLTDCEDPDTCRGCLPRRASEGLLCHPCARRFELMLHDAPVVHRWLTGNLTAGEGASRAKEDHERIGGTGDTPTPIKIDILDTRDLLADRLACWADDWAETHHITAPRHTVAADSEFLLRWLPGLLALEWVGDWWAELAETMSAAHALAPWRPAMRRLPGVPCPGCAETNLRIWGGESDVCCGSCGIMMTEARFGHWELVLRAEQEVAS